MPPTSRFVIKFWVQLSAAFLGALTFAHAQSATHPAAPSAAATHSALAPASADVAFAVVYDTSGSMRGTIPSMGGKPEAKYLIARRALASVATRLERFTAPSADPAAPARSLDFGLYIFKIDEAATALPLAPFSAPDLRTWLDTHGLPRDSTPLGLAMQLAGQALLASPAPHKHLLVLTDGANSSGIEPEDALDLLQRESEKKQTPLFVHVIALGIKPSVFVALKERGASLIGASDEKQLQTQLDFILENQILLEAP
jgi:hypothetical protein